jgi:predicted alpha/beta-hydrolase family hydrolase
VKAMVFYGFPLHPVNVPGIERAKHLKDGRIPMLFLQGTKDALARPELIAEVCESLPLAQLISFEKADHSFKVGKTELIVDLAKNTSEYLRSTHLM